MWRTLQQENYCSGFKTHLRLNWIGMNIKPVVKFSGAVRRCRIIRLTIMYLVLWCDIVGAAEVSGVTAEVTARTSGGCGSVDSASILTSVLAISSISIWPMRWKYYQYLPIKGQFYDSPMIWEYWQFCPIRGPTYLAEGSPELPPWHPTRPHCFEILNIIIIIITIIIIIIITSEPLGEARPRCGVDLSKEMQSL